ncbi:polysaccharide ABC transporter ATP-binding protein [Alienimonas chondri]|uniref:Vitamin B12 import ATP-binding protein BtuD n=1 Tax=Alienimonas chondri TaxID=2681879 RepID=A0ABX1VES1_9PLAN|nr:polysaccharide ABC transporter ATP-binding protein [Alienimonas chondri]NNJ26224.1 Vitamin B12 import ATP-binding protein BtuD [Alienimonas chondri]
MSAAALRVAGLGKRYQLGLTHAGSLSEAASRLTRRLRGLPPVEAPVDAAPGTDPADKKGDFWALKDLSFEVQPGEVVGVIGRNGAGKSTLLKILSRVTSPTVGEVRVRGRVGSLLEVGTGFHPELTGRENVYMNATLLGMSKREVRAKLDEIVDFSGVEKFLDTPVKRYSSGMKVRLGFAVAAHLEPEVLIVDEVLSVGDAEFQRKCLGKMKDVAGEGRTVLFVSHNASAVRELTSRALLLSGGAVIQDGPTSDVLSFYRDSSTRGDGNVRSAERAFSGLSGQLRLLEARVEQEEVPFGGSIRAELEIESAILAGEYTVGITIFSQNDQPVASGFSPSISPPAPGSTGAAGIEISALRLAPGNYHCTVSLCDARSHSTLLHDSISNTLSFAVVGYPVGVGRWMQGWGGVALNLVLSDAGGTRTGKIRHASPVLVGRGVAPNRCA